MDCQCPFLHALVPGNEIHRILYLGFFHADFFPREAFQLEVLHSPMRVFLSLKFFLMDLFLSEFDQLRDNFYTTFDFYQLKIWP